MISFLDASSAREVWALVWDLLLLAWTGQPLEIEPWYAFWWGGYQDVGDDTLQTGDGGGGGERDFALGARGASRFAFMLMYLFFVLVSLVLLINYLIAMLSDTHASQKNAAELTRRVTFARRVLRMELLATRPFHFGPTNAGSPHPEKKGKWVHTFTVCSTNAEGISGLGGKNLFDDLKPDADGGGRRPAQQPAAAVGCAATGVGCRETRGLAQTFGRAEGALAASAATHGRERRAAPPRCQRSAALAAAAGRRRRCGGGGARRCRRRQRRLRGGGRRSRLCGA